MRKYFQATGNGSFILFSTTHILTLLVLLLILITIYVFRYSLRRTAINNVLRLIFATILILSEISLHIWLWQIGAWTAQFSLPLHLSSISLILSAILLLTRNFSLFEFTYFAGMGSAIQAMITPDISAYTFPHFRYVHFFISHGGIVVANLFMVFVEGYKPTIKSLFKAFLYLNLYALLIFFLNILMNGNYMYISEKPLNPSLLDYLGPWPYYLIPLEFIAIVTFFALYLPFGLRKLLVRIRR